MGLLGHFVQLAPWDFPPFFIPKVDASRYNKSINQIKNPSEALAYHVAVIRGGRSREGLYLAPIIAPPLSPREVPASWLVARLIDVEIPDCQTEK